MLHLSNRNAVLPGTIDVLRAVTSAAAALDLQCFVVGAMARDIVLTGVFGWETGRATRDVDLAVSVANWDEFHQLKQRLLDSGTFAAVPGVTHRLNSRVGNGPDYPLDLIPFGGVETVQTIAWAPEMRIMMSVAGYQEANDAAIEVAFDDDFAVRVASLAGLAILKLIAWQDRGHENSKDAIDFGTLLQSYGDAGNLDRLYGSEMSLLERAQFDIRLAGAGLLGRDVRSIASEATLTQLKALLARDIDRLVAHPAGHGVGAGDLNAESALLNQFSLGLRGQ